MGDNPQEGLTQNHKHHDVENPAWGQVYHEAIVELKHPKEDVQW
jgi:hypothetical protein